jgi:hypothetical protein
MVGSKELLGQRGARYIGYGMVLGATFKGTKNSLEDPKERGSISATWERFPGFL